MTVFQGCVYNCNHYIHNGLSDIGYFQFHYYGTIAMVNRWHAYSNLGLTRALYTSSCISLTFLRSNPKAQLLAFATFL